MFETQFDHLKSIINKAWMTSQLVYLRKKKKRKSTAYKGQTEDGYTRPPPYAEYA